jgi:hypothetical protein
MPRRGMIYCKKISGWLLIMLLALNISYATSDQTLSGLTKISLGSGMGDTAPSVAFNSNANEYLVVYTKADILCLTQQKIYGTIINSISGEKENTFGISDCANSLEDLSIIYSEDNDEYVIGYKIKNAGAKIVAQTINATSFSISSPIELDNVLLGDPFKKITLTENQSSNTYVIGYHEEISASENNLIVRYVDSKSKSLRTYSSQLGTGLIANSNDGLNNAKLLSLDNKIFACFELMLLSGSEIWGTFIDPLNGALLPNEKIFQISPSPGGDSIVINPSPAINPNTDEILVAYERSHLQISTASLNTKLKGQIINLITGNRIGNEKSLSNVPNTGEPYEDAKLPSICYSSLSNEFIIHYYGRWWVNSSANKYNSYLERIDGLDISTITPSGILISNDVGSVIEDNNSLHPLGIAHNSINNQFLAVWNVESTNEVVTQIWRYDNNPPSNLRISNNVQNENKPVGTVFATLSANDPDPEDPSPNFTFVDGIGGEDNAFFTIVNSELRIAENLNYEEASTRSVKIRAADSHGAFTDKVFTLTIIDINEAPDNLSLSVPLSVEENADNFTSTITVEDEDFGDTHTLALIAGDSSNNNSNFEILSGNTLNLKVPVNFEDTSMQYVRIRATDAIGLSKEKAFAIQVVDVNEPMETMLISPQAIPENDPDAFVTIEIVDPDETQDYTITLTAGEGDDDNTSFTPVDNKLQVISPFNFEVKDTYKIRVKAKEGAYAVDQAFIVSVSDINDAPDSITISSRQVMDGRGAGFAIGKIFTFDQDEGDEHTLSLIEGADFFSIDTNDSLLTKIPLVYSYSNPLANFYNITIRSEDKGGSAISKSLSIEVIPFSDTEVPKILNFEDNDQFILSDVQQDFSLSIDATDNEKLDTVLFYYRQIRSRQSFVGYKGTQQTKNNEKFYSVEVPLNTSEMDEMGIEYYFKVIDAAGNADSTVVGYTYKMYASKIFEPTGKSYNGDFASYKIVSNPFSLGSNGKVSKIFSDYGSSSDKTWRLFRYDGSENIEIDKSTTAAIVQGDGYWFNKMPILEQAIVLDNAQAPANNRENEFVLNLAKGWNLIGNPYPFPLNWNEVRTHNELTSNDLVLYTFNGEYREANTLDIFEGGYVYSEIDTEIDIPIVQYLLPGRIASDQKPEYEWRVNFTLENPQLKNRLSGLGMHNDASLTFDHFDRPLLPRFIIYADISFNHPEHPLEEFSRDIAPTAEKYVWDFVASSNSLEKSFMLNWSKPAFNSSDERLMLYDINHDVVTDMMKESSYSLDLSHPVAFKAIYGNQSFIDAMLSEVRVSALNPYPNPFRSKIFLPLSLPDSNEEYSIECSIFNLLGEQVFKKNEDNISGGSYKLKWEDHQELQKGIYIYSIKIKNMFLAKEFHGRIVKN